MYPNYKSLEKRKILLSDGIHYIHLNFYQFLKMKHRVEYVGIGIINLLIDLLAILQKSLDRAMFLYDFIREAR